MGTMVARTQHQIFDEWKASGPTGKWHDYWVQRWDKQLSIYEALGWSLIPIYRREKFPARDANWKSDRFSYDVIRWHIRQGGNVAVNAGDSHLVVLDYDSKYLPPELERMCSRVPTISTAKGFAYVTHPPSDGELFDRLKANYPHFDSPRGEGKYELLPLSETCAMPKHGLGGCHHDFRVREWVGEWLRLPIPPFTKFAEMALEAHE
jgi:hypothetical protein